MWSRTPTGHFTGFPRTSSPHFGELERLQPVKDCAVLSPRSPGAAGDRSYPCDRLALHFKIDFGVSIRCCRACMTQQMADRGQVDAGLEERDRRAVAAIPGPE